MDPIEQTAETFVAVMKSLLAPCLAKLAALETENATLRGDVLSLRKQLDALPEGKAGPPGPEGPPGRDGLSVTGPPGRDGESGRDGKDGRDGLGFSDIKGEYDARGHLWVNFQRGDRVERFRVPSQPYQGVWSKERAQEYQKGETVTYSGSLWTALVDRPAGQPGLPLSGWQLCVQRGREGKSGTKGDAGKDGTPGKDGGLRAAGPPAGSRF